MQKKQIVVNDPLVYRGIRFYQSSYGPDRQDRQADPFRNCRSDGSGEKQGNRARVGQTRSLDADTTVQLAEFFPDYVVRDGQVYNRSNSSKIRRRTWS